MVGVSDCIERDLAGWGHLGYDIRELSKVYGRPFVF